MNVALLEIMEHLFGRKCPTLFAILMMPWESGNAGHW